MRRWVLLLILLVAPGCAEVPGNPVLGTWSGAQSVHFPGEPGAGVVWIDYFASNPSAGGRVTDEVLRDIVTHLPSSYGNTYYDSDPITWGHETSHGIHSDLRNYHNNTGQRANGFYCLNDRAAIVIEPGIRKSDVNPYVPASLRGSRYDLYLRGSQAWDDTPTYILDEWIAYINGGEVGISMVEGGRWDRGWRDGVAGQLEFTVYAIALAQAVKEGDPDYWASNQQFKEFIAYNVRRSMRIYRRGAVMEDFAWERQDAYLQTMETSPDAAAWRAFAEEFLGRQWAQEVLFGNDTGPDPVPDAGPGSEEDVPPDEGGAPDAGPGPEEDPGLGTDAGRGDTGGQADPGPDRDPRGDDPADDLDEDRRRPQGNGDEPQWTDEPRQPDFVDEVDGQKAPGGCTSGRGGGLNLGLWLRR